MSSMRMWDGSEGYGEGRKSWYEQVKVVAEVDEFGHARLFTRARGRDRSQSFLPRSDTSNY
jgi:hypothetical protein